MLCGANEERSLAVTLGCQVGRVLFSAEPAVDVTVPATVAV